MLYAVYFLPVENLLNKVVCYYCMVSKIKSAISKMLVGVSFIWFYVNIGPYINAKFKNFDFNLGYGQEYVIKRERSQLEELVNKYDKSKISIMINSFDKITDFDNVSRQIVEKFRLNDYKPKIKKQVSSIPDIESYSDLWISFGRLGIPPFNGVAFESTNTIFLNKTADSFNRIILNHEYVHSIGGINGIFDIFIARDLVDLNEGLTQYFANRIFNDNAMLYYPEQKLVDIFEKIGRYIERKEGLSYSILAKCFFVDRSLNEFVERFDNTFGIGKFNSIFDGKGDFYDKGVKFNSLLDDVKRKELK